MTEHRSPEIRTQQILAAARACFIRRGYFQTKVVDIAQEAGLSKGGIYFHFSSKREIFRVLVQQEYNLAMSFLDDSIASDKPLIEKFSMLGQFFVNLFADQSQSKFMITICEMALRDEEVGKMCIEMQKHYYERINVMLEMAVENGELNPMHTKATSILLKSLIDGIQLNLALIELDVDVNSFIESAVIMLTQGLTKQEE